MMRRKAFTLIEVLMVIAILAIFLGFSTAFTRSSLTNSQFQVTVNEIKQSLLLTQNLSRQSYRDMTSGVAFETDSFTEFTADVYSDVDTNNYTYELPPSITLDNIDFNGGTEIYFEKFTGDPIDTGGLVINHSDGRSATIIVDAEGNISVTFN